MKYTRLTLDERYHIQAYRENDKSIGWIASTLKRSHSTISRELRRNTVGRKYKADQALCMANNRHAYRNKQRRKLQGALVDLVIARLRLYDSPEQISGWLKVVHGIQLCMETIYQLVYSPMGKRLKLKTFLRHGGRKYQRRDKRKYAGRGYIKNRVDIDQRPAIVEEKQRIGDWELDTIVGAGHRGYLVSIVERVSKYTKLILVQNAKAETISAAIINALYTIRNKVFTITADNGKEFAGHEIFSAALQAQSFFAKPYQSWQRGLNEHTNGLVRQFLPKKTNFLTINTNFVQWIEDNLNNRPRKILNFQSPKDVFFAAT